MSHVAENFILTVVPYWLVRFTYLSYIFTCLNILTLKLYGNKKLAFHVDDSENFGFVTPPLVESKLWDISRSHTFSWFYHRRVIWWGHNSYCTLERFTIVVSMNNFLFLIKANTEFDIHFQLMWMNLEGLTAAEENKFTEISVDSAL